MNISTIMGIARESIMIVLLLTGILIVPPFIASLLISIFQATTQIQEQTLTFIPKFVITMLILLFLGPFLISKLSEHFLSILMLIERTV